MDESAQSAWCREHGAYPQQLQQWFDSATQALAEPEEARAGPQQTKNDRKRIRELERELHRKDKALQRLAKPPTVLMQLLDCQVRQRHQQAGINELQFGCLHHAVEAVTCPDNDPLEQVHLLENPALTRDRLAIQSGVAAELGVVAHLACRLREGTEES
jgi:hypothetical protein